MGHGKSRDDGRGFDLPLAFEDYLDYKDDSSADNFTIDELRQKGNIVAATDRVLRSSFGQAPIRSGDFVYVPTGNEKDGLPEYAEIPRRQYESMMEKPTLKIPLFEWKYPMWTVENRSEIFNITPETAVGKPIYATPSDARRVYELMERSGVPREALVQPVTLLPTRAENGVVEEAVIAIKSRHGRSFKGPHWEPLPRETIKDLNASFKRLKESDTF